MQAMKRRAWRSGYLQATAAVAVTTTVCLLLRRQLGTIDVAMIQLLGVVAVSAAYRRGPALLASILSIAAFDFLFVPPYYRFSVHDSAYYLTFAVMLLVAITMSRLTARIREQGESAAERERRTALLYAMDRELAEASDLAALIASAEGHLSRTARGEAWIQLYESGRPLEFPPGGGPGSVFDSAAVRVAATWAMERQEPAGWSTTS